MRTQAKDTLHYMQHKGSITALEGVLELGVIDLAGRIRDLKEEGWIIASDWIKAKNRYGRHIQYKKYILKGRKEDGKEI